MKPSISSGDGWGSLKVLWEDGERLFCRGHRLGSDGGSSTVLAVLPTAEHPSTAFVQRLAHEYDLRDELDGAWAVRPLELIRDGDRTMLVLEDPGGEPLAQLPNAPPLEIGSFLRLAAGMAAALGKAHQSGLVHKDVKPANILRCADGQMRLTGFGMSSRRSRERPMPEPPETIAGTLAYMAPEQTGRMNRSIDSRSDLYALGVTFYELLTGMLPFAAVDPMEWVHSHIARRPTPPHERRADIPTVVSGIVTKLLAKTAEERYQTAAAVERDLRTCVAQLEAQHRIDDFQIGEHDTPDRLLISEKLYGREREIETLLGAFDRIVKDGTVELVLVSGYSGIGKSSFVNELHRGLGPSRGLFASGKFDQYKRDIPYATLAQAFRSLIRDLLAKSEADLAPWRDALREALGPNGQLMVDLVPELKHIIGEQPPVPELEPQQTQGRFQLVFRRLLGVFARPEHPLVLFLDDLQWLDAATLDLLEDLLAQADVQHLLLIAAFRDNEVDARRSRMLEAAKKAGAKISEIALAPLNREQLEQLIADMLQCGPRRAAPLSLLVHEKTAGNPFFALQFISEIAEEGLLNFDHEDALWRWDLKQIRDKGYTENVVELMVARLARLPAETQKVLQQLACLGTAADITTLALLLGASEEKIHTALWEAVRLELVEHLPGTYRFVHDRVQEAAYSLIPKTATAATHLRIGRFLLARTPPESREEAIFEIVNQLNRGAALIASLDEREQLAELNIIAGKRAKAATAYASALSYLDAGGALLQTDCWERRHELAFALELNRAECELLTGNLAAADERLANLSRRARDTVERATVTCLRVDLYTALDQSARAVDVCLDFLRYVGIDLPQRPAETEARREYDRVWSKLDGRPIDELVDLPLMTDPESLATLEVLTKLSPPSMFTDGNLNCLVTCTAVNLSLDRGNCDGSCVHYVWLGCLAGALFGDYKAGHKFGQLGYELVEGRGLRQFQARTYVLFGGLLVIWMKHFHAGRPPLRQALEIADKIGDLTFASFSRNNLNINLLAAGDPLSEVQHEVEDGLEFAQKSRFGLMIDILATQLGLVRTLRGLTTKFGSLEHEQLDVSLLERRVAQNPSLSIAECWYRIRKLQACFFAGDYVTANEAASSAERLLWTSPAQFETAEYHFYAALSLAASLDRSSFGARQRAALKSHHGQLKIWAENCPENFANRAALVGAEIARLEGRNLHAEHLFEQAIRSARSSGFVHNEALAYEVASRFYAQRGFETFSHAYLRKARDGYLRWGAAGKVRQLDDMHPHLRADDLARTPTSIVGEPVEHLDLATVIKVSQAVSGEIVLEKLLDTLMRTAIEQAGAARGLLVLSRGVEPRVVAEATTSGNAIIVQLRDETITATDLPQAVLHHVVRANETLILDNAAAENPFSSDPYIAQHQTRSILCLPLLNQGQLTGVLYLENNLASRVFVPARIAVLRLIASQAAISLENTRLYRDLAEREARIRRLVDANIIGIFIWHSDGRILEANDAFLRIVGYNREDLDVGGLRWTDLTSPDWFDHDTQVREEERTTGTIRPSEREYFRKDGTPVPVLRGSTTFEEGGNQGVAFVLDLTERKRAEAEARDSERRYRDVQGELAHANRVATIGQLTASIAHEVNQPITGVVGSGQAALRWLDKPDVEAARRAIERVIRDGVRAGEVINGLRGFVRKGPPRTDSFDMNEAIREVIVLIRGEAAKNGASIEAQLADGLPFIQGDRIQLQQVVLNLAINAIEAMTVVGEGPLELLIKAEKSEPGFVSVSVKDSGPGLDPANLVRVFETFYTTKPEGLGLGLSICRSIIEAHGGRLWAWTNEPRGAVFQFTLPLLQDETGSAD